MLGIAAGMFITHKLNQLNQKTVSTTFDYLPKPQELVSRKAAYVFALKAFLSGTAVCAATAYTARFLSYKYLGVDNLKDFSKEFNQMMGEKEVRKNMSDNSEPLINIFKDIGNWTKTLDIPRPTDESRNVDENGSVIKHSNVFLDNKKIYLDKNNVEEIVFEKK